MGCPAGSEGERWCRGREGEGGVCRVRGSAGGEREREVCAG